MHKAVFEGNLQELKSQLDKPKMVEAADHTGLPPLHKAVVLGQSDLVQELANQHKSALELKDNVSMR